MVITGQALQGMEPGGSNTGRSEQPQDTCHKPRRRNDPSSSSSMRVQQFEMSIFVAFWVNRAQSNRPSGVTSIQSPSASM